MSCLWWIEILLLTLDSEPALYGDRPSPSSNPCCLLSRWAVWLRDEGACYLIANSTASLSKSTPCSGTIAWSQSAISPSAPGTCICPAWTPPPYPMPGSDSIMLSGGLVFCSGPSTQWSFAKAAERTALPRRWCQLWQKCWLPSGNRPDGECCKWK